MSVCGMDVGASASCVAIARKRGSPRRDCRAGEASWQTARVSRELRKQPQTAAGGRLLVEDAQLLRQQGPAPTAARARMPCYTAAEQRRGPTCEPPPACSRPAPPPTRTDLTTPPRPRSHQRRLNSGIDVLLNAESVRETPAMVSFGDKQRFIGVHAAGKVRTRYS